MVIKVWAVAGSALVLTVILVLACVWHLQRDELDAGAILQKDIETNRAEERQARMIAQPSTTPRGVSKKAHPDLKLMLHRCMVHMATQFEEQASVGTRARHIFEKRVGDLADKAKDFSVRQLNNICMELMNRVEDDEAKMILDFNAAVEASFPPASVLLAGVTSPALLTIKCIWHLLQVLCLFLPVFFLTLWAGVLDIGAECDIPSLHIWIYVALLISAVQVVGHTVQFRRIRAGQASLKMQTQSIQQRFNVFQPEEDREVNFGDLRDMFVGYTVLVQEALILEDTVRKSPYEDILGMANAIWVVAVVWVFFVVIVWTFVPGVVAFHLAAADVAKGSFCGAWRSVFTVRLVCLLVPFFFFMNLASFFQWVLDKLLRKDDVSVRLLNLADHFDQTNGGLPVMQTVVKAFVLRAGPDAAPARLTVALGEHLRLCKEREDLQARIRSIEQRITQGKIKRRELRRLANTAGECLEDNIKILESGGMGQVSRWKEHGLRVAIDAESRARASARVETEDVDRMFEYVQKLAATVKNSEVVQNALEKVRSARSELQTIRMTRSGSGSMSPSSAAHASRRGSPSGMSKVVTFGRTEDP